ncbi:helix-turn-helix domain-containing protein [Cyclobacterium sp. SYSU L10401]|uniref:helix-turn-helix domain-containing protein n=1 Tax=Cyclobacterium sp. SYSU L10401 TaxID=2678657 RepID=UPI0013D4C2A4|nr:helix-turn-helix domain-containing protein [Cyclobacterium sp. SYSU L10401]
MSLHNEKLFYTIPEAMHQIGIGRTKLYQELNSGRLKAVKAGKRTLIPKKSLMNWEQELQGYLTETRKR